VNPTASNNLLGQGSATLGRTQSTQPQQTNRDPVPESGDQDTVGSVGTQIRIVIPRPGGEQ
jgi:hypothetical protein